MCTGLTGAKHCPSSKISQAMQSTWPVAGPDLAEWPSEAPVLVLRGRGGGQAGRKVGLNSPGMGGRRERSRVTPPKVWIFVFLVFGFFENLNF